MINDSAIADRWKHATDTSRLISLGFYDGTTSGLIELEIGIVFRYDVVSWDDHEDRRVYCLARIPVPAFAELIKLLSSSETPRWPQWFPRWESSPDIQRSVDNLLDQAGPYSVVGLGTDITSVDDAVALEGRAYDRAEDFRRNGQMQPFNDWLPVFVGKR
jgi:hypothetical protein